MIFNHHKDLLSFKYLSLVFQFVVNLIHIILEFNLDFNPFYFF